MAVIILAIFTFAFKTRNKFDTKCKSTNWQIALSLFFSAFCFFTIIIISMTQTLSESDSDCEIFTYYVLSQTRR